MEVNVAPPTMVTVCWAHHPHLPKWADATYGTVFCETLGTWTTYSIELAVTFLNRLLHRTIWWSNASCLFPLVFLCVLTCIPQCHGLDSCQISYLGESFTVARVNIDIGTSVWYWLDHHCYYVPLISGTSFVPIPCYYEHVKNLQEIYVTTSCCSNALHSVACPPAHNETML